MTLQLPKGPRFSGFRSLLFSALTLSASACADDIHGTTEGNFSASATEASTEESGSSTTGFDSTYTTTGEASESITESTSSTGGTESDTGSTTAEDPNCKDKRTLFITSNRFTGALGGLSEADGICGKVYMNRQNEDINPDTLFVQAWLADDENSPSTRLPEFCGEYQDPNETVIAKSHEDLLNSELVNPLVVDENGEEVSGSVWSNVTLDGESLSPEYHCEGWTSDLSDRMGFTGEIGAEGDQWTSDTAEKCNSNRRLICVVVKK